MTPITAVHSPAELDRVDLDPRVRRVHEHRLEVLDVLFEPLRVVSVGPVHDHVLGVALVEPRPLLAGEDGVVQRVERAEVRGGEAVRALVLRQPGIRSAGAGRYGCDDGGQAQCMGSVHRRTSALDWYAILHSRKPVSNRDAAGLPGLRPPAPPGDQLHRRLAHEDPARGYRSSPGERRHVTVLVQRARARVPPPSRLRAATPARSDPRRARAAAA